MGVSREDAELAARAALKIIEHEDRATKPTNSEAPPFDLKELCLSPAEWEARDIEPEDTLLGPFSTTTRIELSADTGLGKTMLGLALAHAKALGRDFLHWNAVRPGRVLFLDGEMPQGLIKARLKVARSWFDLNDPLGRDQLCVLSREDIPDMPPLDTPEGARFVLNAFDQLGRFDHVTFDNRACLAVGDLSGEDASTTALKTLQRQITKLRTGQLWLHHTGHDGTRGYGRKAREWELDTVMVGERLEDRPELDVGMRLTFSKARRRTPDNRADYEPVEIELRQGQWFWQQADAGKVPAKGKNQRPILEVAKKLLAGSDTKAPPGHVASNRTVISVEALKDETKRVLSVDPKHFASRFNDALNSLTSNRQLAHYDGQVWLP